MNRQKKGFNRIKRKYFLLIHFWVLFQATGSSQERNQGITVSMSGYIINLGGEILFQPCEDSSVNFWKSLNSTSFQLTCNQFVNSYCDVIQNIGDSVTVEVLNTRDSIKFESNLSYFYCSLEVYLPFLGTNENDFLVYSSPRYRIFYNKKEYVIRGFYIRDMVQKILPKNINDLRQMYDNYWNKGHSVPKWLEDYIDKNILGKKNK